MNGELVKRQDRWDLYAEDGSKIGSSAPNPMNKLSLKNCQVIKNGYDLDEVVEDIVKTIVPNDRGEDIWYGTSMAVGKLCFQKALEILGDKKFSLDDMKEAYGRGFLQQGVKSFNSLIQSLQQTEWDVEIVTEKFFEVKGNDGIVIRAEAMEEFGERNDYKLDADGCLILKRK